MGEASLNFRSPSGTLSDPSSPSGWRDGHTDPGLLLHERMTAGVIPLGPACKPELSSALLRGEAGSQLPLAAP